MNLENIIYALLAGVLPALLWLWFWLREDNLHPEPKSLIAISFLAGCTSVIIAIILEKIAQDFILDTTYRYIAWSAIEEIIKFGVFAIVIFKSKFFDEPIDAMIYLITIALGFAAIENTLFILSSLSTSELTSSLITGNLRFIGASLVHVVSSAVLGFMIGISIYKNSGLKFFSVLLGIILSIVLHTAFNLAIISTTATNTLKVFGGVWITVVILIILFEEIKAVKPKEGLEKV